MNHQLDLNICLDEDEAAGQLGSAYYIWSPGGCVFPRDVLAIVIYLPTISCDLNNTCKPFKFVVGEFRLTGTYFQPTLNPAIHWEDTSGHIVNGKLLECPESHTIRN